MNFLESFRLAVRSLSANKMRSILTMLGIIIGTGAVIALISLGEGAQSAITDQVQSIGSNLIFVVPGVYEQGSDQVRNYQPLTREDAEALSEPGAMQYVAQVAPAIERSATIASREESVQVAVVGTTPAYEQVRNYPVTLGYWFSVQEEENADRVALLGVDTAEDLFEYPDLAIGETIRINKVPFEVIGILEEKGAGGFGGGSQDALAIIPLSTAQKRLFSGRFVTTRGQRVDVINVSAIAEEQMDNAIDEITWLLRERHNIEFGEDDFTVLSQQDILGVFNTITDYFTLFLGFVAGISLLVGGIGIMNIMLVSVTERTREIGIRKSVGAKRSAILWQFLIESVVLSILGGFLGIAFGWAVSAIVNSLDMFTTVVSPGSVMLAVSFSLLVGLFFGIYPASRAANLNPIDALRYE